MRSTICVLSAVGLFLATSSAVAAEAAGSSESAEFSDSRTEAQRSFDAAEEAKDDAALQALKARIDQGTAKPRASQDSSGPVEAVQQLPVSPAMQEAALAPLRSAGVVAQEAQVQSSTMFLMRDCYHLVLTVADSGRPPRYHLVVVRLPAPLPECTAASTSREIDSSYVDSFQVAVKGGQGFALAFQSKQTPSGSGLVHVRLFQIAPKDLSVVRAEFLGTFRGSTWVNEMHFEGHRLVVETNRYTATYPHFLTSTLPPEGVIFP